MKKSLFIVFTSMLVLPLLASDVSKSPVVKDVFLNILPQQELAITPNFEPVSGLNTSLYVDNIMYKMPSTKGYSVLYAYLDFGKNKIYTSTKLSASWIQLKYNFVFYKINGVLFVFEKSESAFYNSTIQGKHKYVKNHPQVWRINDKDYITYTYNNKIYLSSEKENEWEERHWIVGDAVLPIQTICQIDKNTFYVKQNTNVVIFDLNKSKSEIQITDVSLINIDKHKLLEGMVDGKTVFYDNNWIKQDGYKKIKYYGTDYYLHTKTADLQILFTKDRKTFTKEHKSFSGKKIGKHNYIIATNADGTKDLYTLDLELKLKNYTLIQFDTVKLFTESVGEKTLFYYLNFKPTDKYKKIQLNKTDYYLHTKTADLQILFTKDSKTFTIEHKSFSGKKIGEHNYIIATNDDKTNTLYTFDLKNKIENYTGEIEPTLLDQNLLEVTVDGKPGLYKTDLTPQPKYTKIHPNSTDYYLHTKTAGLQILFTKDGKASTKEHKSFSGKKIGKHNYIIATNADNTNTLYTFDLKNKIENYTEIKFDIDKLLNDNLSTEDFTKLIEFCLPSTESKKLIDLFKKKNSIKTILKNLTSIINLTPPLLRQVMISA